MVEGRKMVDGRKEKESEKKKRKLIFFDGTLGYVRCGESPLVTARCKEENLFWRYTRWYGVRQECQADCQARSAFSTD